MEHEIPSGHPVFGGGVGGGREWGWVGKDGRKGSEWRVSNTTMLWCWVLNSGIKFLLWILEFLKLGGFGGWVPYVMKERGTGKRGGGEGGERLCRCDVSKPASLSNLQSLDIYFKIPEDAAILMIPFSSHRSQYNVTNYYKMWQETDYSTLAYYNGFVALFGGESIALKVYSYDLMKGKRGG